MNNLAKKEFQLQVNDSWFEEGLKHIWLPYTQMQHSPTPLPIVDAEGCSLKLLDGRKLIDGTSSWWSVCHGYKQPHIVNSIKDQAEKLSHVMFAGLAHEPAYTLAERLSCLTGLDRVFFSDSGSTAVEVAMKMTFQYWRNKGDNKTKFISFRNGYHGDTMGAMSLADPNDWVHAAFTGYVPEQICLDLPKDKQSFRKFENTIDKHKGEVAAVIIEPLMQAAGGFKFHSQEILKEIHRITKQYNVLFIADEIATGFGRLGTMFACDKAGIKPDIMCIGKALTGGYIPFAATLTTKQIFEKFLDEGLGKAFMHGPTYMGNPLACSAANASLDLFESEPRLNQVKNIEQQLREELLECRNLDAVADVRVNGAVGAVELKECDWNRLIKMRQSFIEKGVWLRPFDNVAYISPPFSITEEDLSELTKATYLVLKDL